MISSNVSSRGLVVITQLPFGPVPRGRSTVTNFLGSTLLTRLVRLARLVRLTRLARFSGSACSLRGSLKPQRLHSSISLTP